MSPPTTRKTYFRTLVFFFSLFTYKNREGIFSAILPCVAHKPKDRKQMSVSRNKVVNNNNKKERNCSPLRRQNSLILGSVLLQKKKKEKNGGI